jgi:Flp pilus assembly protein TadD
MILSPGEKDQLTTSTPSPRFDLPAPSGNPLVASSPVVVTKTKNTVEVLWNQGPAARQQFSPESVFEQLSELAKRDALRFPGSARAHANLGSALAKADRLDEAAEELEIALSIEPNEYLAGVELARVYVRKENYDRARQLFDELLRYYPNSESILLSRAYLALRDNDFTGAEGFLRSILRVRKGAAFPHFLLGITKLQSGNPHAAIAALKEAARLNVRRAEYHHALGVAYEVAGESRRAERAFRTALALSPEVEATVHALSIVLLKQGQPDNALELLRPFVESHPSDANGRDLLAKAYYDVRKYAHARTQLQIRLEIAGGEMSDEERARVLTNIAATLLQDGKGGPAETALNRAIELAPNWSSIPYENLAHVWVQSEQWDKAVHTLEHAKRLFPAQQSLRRFLAGVYARLDRYDEAIAELTPLYELGIAEPETSSALGTFYEWTGDYDSAIRLQTEAYDRSPKEPAIINNLAYTYLMAGNVEAARGVLESMPKSAEPHVELVATQGLLRLWEGDRAQGKLLYERAEQMASKAGNRNLARRVRQKKYLELAKDSLRRGDLAAARLEIARGLSIRPDSNSFRVKLEDLLSKL